MKSLEIRPTELVVPTRDFTPVMDTPNEYLMTHRTRATRLIALKGNNRGSFIGALTAWINGRWQAIVFESRHELMTAYILLANPRLDDLWDQAERVGFWGADGKWHHHTFDYLATIDGKKHAVACKLESSTERLEFRTTLGLIAHQNGHFADEVVLVTEKAFSREWALECELRHFIGSEIDDETDAVVLPILAGIETSMTIRDIVAASGRKGKAWQSIVRLIQKGYAQTVPGTRIDDYDTLIVRGALS